MVLESSIRSRRRGAILGLAVGDALGAAVEFQPPGSFAEVTDYRAGGPHGLDPGEWTDDTSMALALADSIGEVGWDLTDQAKRYVSWWHSGVYSVNGRTFDIGITTSRSLQRFRETGDARISGDPSSRASGNGSIMRLAPVPVAYIGLFPDQLPLLIERLVDSSRPTHGSPQCLSACAYFGVILCGLLHGLPREQVLDPDWGPIRQRSRPLPAPSRGSRCRRGQLPRPQAAPDPRIWICRKVSRGRSLGLSRRDRLPGSRAARGQPGR